MYNFVAKAFIVSRYTFIEVYKSKIMLNVLILGLAIAVMSFIAAEFTYGVPGRVALDIGLGLLSLSAIGISVFMGATLISKEIEQRTVYMTLSRPVGRVSFLLGRVLGMILILLINILLLGIIIYLVTVMFGGEVGPLFIWTILLSYVEAIILLFIVICCSLVANTIITVISSLTIYATGHALIETMTFTTVKSNTLLLKLLKVLEVIFPNFSKLNIKPYLLYEQNLPPEFLWNALGYGAVYGLMMFVVAAILFVKKSLD